VYITDANKLYWPYDSSSTAMSRWLGHINQQTLLQQEINAINPCTVLLVGNVAQTAFTSIKASCHKVVSTPHIKARANAWAKYGVIPATNNNKLNYIKQRLP
jgi:uracil-DNA glycosylase